MKTSIIITSLMGAAVLASPAGVNPSLYKYSKNCSLYLCRSHDYYKDQYQYKTSVYKQCLERNQDERDCQAKCPLYRPEIQTCKPGWKDILDYGRDYYSKYGNSNYGRDDYGNDNYGNDKYDNDKYNNDKYENDKYNNDKYNNDKYNNDKYNNDKNSGGDKPSKEYSDNTSVVWGRDAEAAEQK